MRVALDRDEDIGERAWVLVGMGQALFLISVSGDGLVQATSDTAAACGEGWATWRLV